MQTDDEPELPVTPRVESTKGDDTPSTFSVAQRWFAESRKTAFLIAVAVLSPLLSLWYVNRSVALMRRELWSWNVDREGVITYAPLAIADPNSRLFHEILLQAGEVYLKRNPNGLSNNELLPRYFSPGAAAAVKKEIAFTVAERGRRNLFDQPEFTKEPERLDASGGTYRYRLVGYIVRTGVLDGMVERDVGDFKMGVELEPSDSVEDKGRFPFTVKQFMIRVTWRSSPDKTEEVSSTAGMRTVVAQPTGDAQ